MATASVSPPQLGPFESAPARATVRCAGCKLLQFEPGNGRCRKCRKPLSSSAAPRRVFKDAPTTPPEPCAVQLAARLQHFRALRGLSQFALARRMGCNRTYVSKVENHGALPTLDQIHRFAAALDIPVTHLVDDGQGLTRRLLADPFTARVAELIGGLSAMQLSSLRRNLDLMFSHACPRVQKQEKERSL